MILLSLASLTLGLLFVAAAFNEDPSPGAVVQEYLGGAVSSSPGVRPTVREVRRNYE